MQAPTNGNVVKDLLSLDDDDTPRASATAAPASFAEDLLGGLGADSNGHAAAGPAASSSAAVDLLSLLDDSAPSGKPAAHAASAPPPQNALVRVQFAVRSMGASWPACLRCLHKLRPALSLACDVI